MGQTIFPSYNDVGDTEGDGTIFTEDRVKQILGEILTHPGMLSGGAPTNPSGLTIRVAVGSAWIDGRRCEWDAYLEATATASATSYQFLRLDIDGSNYATSISVETRSSPLPPSDRYVLVARTIAGASTVTSLYDERQFAGAGVKTGFYTGDGTSSREITVGRTPTLVMVWKIDGTSDNIVSIGALDPAGRRVCENSLVPASRLYFTAGNAQTLPRSYGGSKAYNQLFTAGEWRTTDITVTGAALNDPAMVWVNDDNYMEDWEMRARVISANTVRVYIKDNGGGNTFNETIYARVLDVSGVTTNLDVANFVNATLTSSQAPVLVDGGFEVSATGTPNLNASGWNYGWIAYF